MPTQTGTTTRAGIVIVTGGSRGLGRSTVLSLAKRGVDSIFTYHSRAGEAAQVVDLVARTGRHALALRLDAGDVGSFDGFVERVLDNPEVNRMVAGMTPLGHAGLPEDIGPMIASLLSEDHRRVNGQRIEVSGGMTT